MTTGVNAFDYILELVGAVAIARWLVRFIFGHVIPKPCEPYRSPEEWHAKDLR